MFSRMALLSVLLWVAAARAQVRTDGTMGKSPRTLGGALITINPEQGRTVGGNLFHSFAQFHVAPGQQVNFTGSSSVRNVLARVTGRQASRVDGVLSCDIEQANLYLINPNGVIFGPDAKVVVSGSFAVSSAAYLKLGRKGRFDAANPHQSVLNSAPPSAFGFLASRAGGVAFEGARFDGNGQPVSTVEARTGKVISVVGQEVRISSARLAAPGGRINLVGAAAAGEVALDASAPGSGVGGDAPAGSVRLENGASIDVSDFAGSGGNVMMRGGNLWIDATLVSSITALDGKGIDVEATATLLIDNASQLFTAAIGEGSGGDVRLAGPLVRVVNSSVVAGVSAATGAGGALVVNAGQLRLGSGGKLLSQSSSAGSGGALSVAARVLSIDGAGDAGDLTGIVSETAPGAPIQLAVGSPGDIGVAARTISIANLGVISGTTRGAQAGGSVVVAAHQIRLDGGGFALPTGIISQSQAGTDGMNEIRRGIGAAGPVDVTALQSLEVLAGASVQGSTFTEGAGGSVRVRAGEINLDGSGLAQDPGGLAGFTGIFGTTAFKSGAVGLGEGASVRVSVERSLRIAAGATIRVNTFGAGQGGQIRVQAGNVLIDRAGAVNNTGISAQAESGSSGNAGAIGVRAGRLTVRNGGRISVATEGLGRAGGLTIDVAGNVILSGAVRDDAGRLVGGIESSSRSDSASASGGDVRVRAGGSIELRALSRITAEAASADAGNLSIVAAHSIRLDNAAITTQSAARGGKIELAAPVSILLSNRSRVTTNSRLEDGGNIDIDPLLFSLDRSMISANGGINGGDIRISADLQLGISPLTVTATGERGLSGVIQIDPANTDVTNSLARLPIALFSRSLNLAPQCSSRVMAEQSNFAITGRGSGPIEPGGIIPEFELSLHP